MRVALYVRVSTEEQKKNGISIDAQISALTLFAETNNYTVAGIYNDAGISARKKYTRRPQLLKLIEDCKAGKIDLILFTKLDRWFRSVADYYDVQEILDECKVPWRAIWEDYETETPAGIFKTNIMLSVAQHEADTTSQRIKAVNQYRRERGEYISGKRPTGYKIEHSQLLVNEEEKAGVHAFFETYLTTLSASKALKAAEDKGLYLTDRVYQRMLSNPTYCGDAHGYKCYAYITKEEFDRIQSIKAASFRTDQKHRHCYPYSGIAYCGCCGRRLTGKYAQYTLNGKEQRRSYYYMCYPRRLKNQSYDCTERPFITEKRLEELILNSISGELDSHAKNVRAVNKRIDVKAAEAKRRKLKEKLDRIGERYEDGDITKEEYIQKRDQVKAEIDAIVLEPKEEPAPLPKGFAAMFKALDNEHKRSVLNAFIEKVYVNADKTISFVFK